MLAFKHSGNVGDIIYSLPTVQALLKRHNQQYAAYYLHTDVPAYYAGGINHPAGNVRLSREFAGSILPLLKAQPYICDVDNLTSQHVDYNLDQFRDTGFDFGLGHIARYYGYAFDVAYDLSKPWLTVEPDASYADAVVINRTNRYLNPNLNYNFLYKHERNIFVGLREEYEQFRRNVRCEYVPTADHYQLARIIAGCKLFIGNQSSAFALAEGLKVPRILEVSCFGRHHCPNVIPHGDEAYDVIGQDMFTKIATRLLGLD